MVNTLVQFMSRMHLQYFGKARVIRQMTDKPQEQALEE